MAKRIITISREFGSGGRFIGEEVAKKLGIAYYDKDIIGKIAEHAGLSPEYVQESLLNFIIANEKDAATHNNPDTAMVRDVAENGITPDNL